MTLKRFDIAMDGFESGLDVKECPDGWWVDYDDYFEVLRRLDNALTHDSVLEKMTGILLEEDSVDRYQLGIAIIAVRKLFRQAVELTDAEFELLNEVRSDDAR